MLSCVRIKKSERRKAHLIKTVLGMENMTADDIFSRENPRFDKLGVFLGDEVPTTILCFLNAGDTCFNGKILLTDIADVVPKEPGFVSLQMKLGRVSLRPFCISVKIS